MRLEGRVALITGASRGVGRATAIAFARRGVAVAIVARTVDPSPRLAGSLLETAESIRAAGGEVRLIAADLSDADAIDDIAAGALAWKGRVDVLVNNAAFLSRASYDSLEQLSLANWRRQIAVNFTAPFLLSKALVPAMRKAGEGVIVNLTSGAGDLYEGDVPGVLYGATKAAVNRFTLALSRDLRPDGIAVFAVDPGYVRTEIAEQAAAASNRNIDDAHGPEVPASVIIELVERDSAAVTGRIFAAVQGEPPVLRHDGRGLGPPEGLY
jgi:NAD(P)-dependent dehydrogenase (short-subunit alcohol dehydrogenase family)